jgi:hypothetical protein
MDCVMDLWNLRRRQSRTEGNLRKHYIWLTGVDCWCPDFRIFCHVQTAPHRSAAMCHFSVNRVAVIRLIGALCYGSGGQSSGILLADLYCSEAFRGGRVLTVVFLELS